MQRSRGWLAVLVALGPPAFAAPAHQPVRARPVLAGAAAGGAFDHVPAAAERIAAAFGLVTSTFRTVSHNREVGSVPNSFHLLGRAIDVARRPGIAHARIAAALRNAGFVLVESLDEGDHSHFAFGAPVAAGAATAAAVPPPQHKAPAAPRVAADNHGTLVADGGGEAGAVP